MSWYTKSPGGSVVRLRIVQLQCFGQPLLAAFDGGEVEHQLPDSDIRRIAIRDQAGRRDQPDVFCDQTITLGPEALLFRTSFVALRHEATSTLRVLEQARVLIQT